MRYYHIDQANQQDLNSALRDQTPGTYIALMEQAAKLIHDNDHFAFEEADPEWKQLMGALELWFLSQAETARAQAWTSLLGRHCVASFNAAQAIVRTTE